MGPPSMASPDSSSNSHFWDVLFFGSSHPPRPQWALTQVDTCLWFHTPHVFFANTIVSSENTRAPLPRILMKFISHRGKTNIWGGKPPTAQISSVNIMINSYIHQILAIYHLSGVMSLMIITPLLLIDHRHLIFWKVIHN